MKMGTQVSIHGAGKAITAFEEVEKCSKRSRNGNVYKAEVTGKKKRLVMFLIMNNVNKRRVESKDIDLSLMGTKK